MTGYCRIFFLALFICIPTLAAADELVIAAVGDIMLAGSGRTVYARKGYDYPFAATSAILKQSDLAVGNLEAPLTRGGKEFRDKRFRFRVDPSAGYALRNAGFSVLTLANNHMLDFGITGLADTINNLDRHGILHAGAGETLTAARQEAIVSVKGKKVAFLSYSLTLPEEFYASGLHPGTAPGYDLYYQTDIARAKSMSDYVVVSFHWGEEKSFTPKPYQVATARKAVDAGADLVLGHHPHVLQGMERYKHGVILYSLGNFAFGSRNAVAARSIIARITLDNGVKEVEVIPLNIRNREVNFQPRPIAGKEADKLATHLSRISESLGTSVIKRGNRYLAVFSDTERFTGN